MLTKTASCKTGLLHPPGKWLSCNSFFTNF